MAHEVGEDVAVGVLDDRALGDGQDEVGAVAAVALVTGTGLAVGRPAVRGVVVVEQRGRLRVDREDDRAALAAVAAVGAAERLELLALDRGHAVPAVTGRDVQDDAVHEVDGHGCSSFRWGWWGQSGPVGGRRRPRGVATNVGRALWCNAPDAC